ncbi:exopolyphosphatase [Clostridium akagii]|uniref:exopolyphosphatase n=1 Tax=Clostridium akagii TaxID=91623 RepID=UPI00047BDB1C|nr:exopolyphosphatase [Clostridium akagii]
MNKKVGIIDIGSNSVRLLLAEIGNEKSFRVINELKEYVRLGDGLDDDDLLSDEKMDLAMKTLSTYKNICDSFQVSHIIAVATEAVRRAKNKTDFLDRTKNIGLDIKILSGNEEAYYDYFSTINSINVDNALIMDIGGASTELILVKNRDLIKSVSLPFGAITLTQHFHINDSLEDEKEKDLINFLKKKLNSLEWLDEANGLPLIGIGGSIRTIAKIHKKSVDYPLNLIHNYGMTSDDIISIYNSVRTKNNTQRKKIKGLSSDRADIFVGAAALVKTLMELCAMKKIQISRNGIREGLLYSYLYKNQKPTDDILCSSINNILINQNSDKKHSEHIYYLFNSLCTKLENLLDNKYNINNIIKASAMLHDIGSNITYYFHHKHSLYMILNSQIYGLTHRELVMSACIAANHRDDNIAVNYQEYKMILDKDDLELIKKLGILLRLSESLDKSMTYKVSDISCDIHAESVIITTISKDSAYIEIKDALSAAESFKTIFNKKLYVV